MFIELRHSRHKERRNFLILRKDFLAITTTRPSQIIQIILVALLQHFQPVIISPFSLGINCEIESFEKRGNQGVGHGDVHKKAHLLFQIF